MRNTTPRRRNDRPPSKRVGRALAALLGLAVFAAIGPGTASAQDAIAIGVDAAYPPYMYADDGQPAGLYVDIIGAVFERMGLPVTIEALA
jgi:ABC-type amino acid transport substrate-binding protein